MSDSDEDNIVRYGTQLEPYEEDHTSAMPKIPKQWGRSKKKRFRKLLAANVNPKTASELCNHHWPIICQLIPELESINPLTSSSNPSNKSKKKQPQLKVRDEFQPRERLSREREPDQAQLWYSPYDNQSNSQDAGPSSNHWGLAQRREYRSSSELETNQESFLDQPYRPPLTYTQEVLHTTQHNYREETDQLQARGHESNRRKQHHTSERESHLRAVKRHYNDSNDDEPSCDLPYKTKKTTSEAVAPVNYWPDLDRPSRLGLRDKTHPPEYAHTYSYSDDKKFREDPRNYQKISWDSSVNLDYRESDRPSRDGLRKETQSMITICIDDDSEEEHPPDVIPVNEVNEYLDFGEADRRGIISETRPRSHWHHPAEPQESSGMKANVNKNAEPIRVGISNIVPMTKQQMTLVHRSINNAIVHIGVQGAGPKFLGSTFKGGWICMICENHESRKWLQKVVPSLKPWAEASLSIMPQEELPKPIIVSILISDKEGVPVATALKLLRVQNPGLNTDNWKVFKVIRSYNGQIVLLSIDEASFEALKLLEFKANLGMDKITFWVRSWPGKQGLLSTPDISPNLGQKVDFGTPPAEVPLASSSAYTEAKIAAETCTGRNLGLTVTKQLRRRLGKRRNRVKNKKPNPNLDQEDDKKLVIDKKSPQLNESYSSSDWVNW